MYDLTVDEAHTFAVGQGAWVVHNANCPTFGDDPRFNELSFDPAKGKYDKNEAHAILEAEKRGILRDPKRNPSGLDFNAVINGKRVDVDIKTPVVTGKNTVENVAYGMAENAATYGGEVHLVFDLRHLTQKQSEAMIHQLNEIVNPRSWRERLQNGTIAVHYINQNCCEAKP